MLQYRERYRPQYHFSAEHGWLNDPNGLVFFNGEYHLFYQHHPFGKTWGPMHWGHAVSKDLVHWQHLPVALYPDHLGTIFSGSAVVDWSDTSGFFGGEPGLVAIFTHSEARGQVQSLAYSTDRGRSWKKYDGNPVLTQFAQEDFRDPKVFWHEPTKQWIMVVAGGKVRIYSSPNLREWVLRSENEIWTECPDLFELAVDGDPRTTKWVLSLGGRKYYIGTFDGERFIPEIGPLPMNYGPDAYAAQTFNDEPRGRRIMISWMNNWEYANSLSSVTDPWNGTMTLPCELSLKTFPEGTRLVQRPVPELQQLRRAHRRFAGQTVRSGANPVAGLRGVQLEIIAEFETGTATEFGIKVRMGGEEETVVGYRTADHVLFLDRNRSGQALSGVYEAPMVAENSRVKMHLFIDWSSLEVFGNDGKVAITSLMFPDPASDGVEVYATGGEVNLVSLDVYELGSIWGEDETTRRKQQCSSHGGMSRLLPK
mgnify:FL=1